VKLLIVALVRKQKAVGAQ